jgi:hypothetical protein
MPDNKNRRPRRKKNEPTKRDILARDYRNRAAMHRVYEAAILAKSGATSKTIRYLYQDPVTFAERLSIVDRPGEVRRA